MARTGDTRPSVHYLPYYRRVVFRSVVFWAVLRFPLTMGVKELEGPDATVHPLALVALAGAVAWVGALYATFMREDGFRANAGISTAQLAVLSTATVALLEIVVRVLSS